MKRERAGALILISNSLLFAHRQRLADLTLKQKIPSMFEFRKYAKAGDRRGRLLLATVSAAVLPVPDEHGVRALHGWLGTWRGIGDLEAGMARQGYDLQLTRYAGEAWRATFFITGREHSAHAATGIAGEKTPWRPVRVAAREALRVQVR